MQKQKTSIVTLLMVIGILAGTFMIGRATAGKHNGAALLDSTLDAKTVDMSLFWEAWDVLQKDYVDYATVDRTQLLYGAVAGMMEATGDPYTTFLDPEEITELNETLEGAFEGIGAEIEERDDVITVVSPLDDMPAQKAGLRAGDKILAVDGTTTAGLSVHEAVEMIRGERGTQVVLTIFRNGEDETRDIAITRGTITVISARVSVDEAGLAHVRLSQFGANTVKELGRALAAHDNIRGIVIDVRNNPGGYLDKAVEVASYFLPKGSTVVRQVDAAGNEDRHKTKRIRGAVSQVPTVVLINEGSASASEILAGALHDHRQVPLIGATSFGKGSVQEVVGLAEGAAKVTIARWLTPAGIVIDEKGIEPTESVELTNEDFDAQRDPQLERAYEALRGMVEGL